MAMKKKISKHLLGAIAVGLAMCFAVPASANWDHVVSGIAFDTVLPSDNAASTLLYRGAFGIQNLGTTPKLVEFPLHRTHTSNTSGTQYTEVWWTGNSTDVACTIASTDPYGNTISNTNLINDFFTSGGVSYINNGPSSVNEGNYTISCELAPNAQLNSVHWREN